MVRVGKYGGKSIEHIHPDEVKELEITSGPYNKTEAKDIQDTLVFKYRAILGEIIFECMS